MRSWARQLISALNRRRRKPLISVRIFIRSALFFMKWLRVVSHLLQTRRWQLFSSTSTIQCHCHPPSRPIFPKRWNACSSKPSQKTQMIVLLLPMNLYPHGSVRWMKKILCAECPTCLRQSLREQTQPRFRLSSSLILFQPPQQNLRDPGAGSLVAWQVLVYCSHRQGPCFWLETGQVFPLSIQPARFHRSAKMPAQKNSKQRSVMRYQVGNPIQEEAS